MTALLAAAGTLPGCASTAARPGADAGAHAATVAELTAIADGWDRAIVRKERDAIAAVMSADFRQIDGEGNVETRQSFIDDLMSPGLRIDPYRVEDFEVRVYGETALLSGRIRMTGRVDGKPFDSHFRYIDTYVRSVGAWQIVSVQITRVPRAAP